MESIEVMYIALRIRRAALWEIIRLNENKNEKYSIIIDELSRILGQMIKIDSNLIKFDSVYPDKLFALVSEMDMEIIKTDIKMVK